jgi:hypothetical protein
MYSAHKGGQRQCWHFSGSCMGCHKGFRAVLGHTGAGVVTRGFGAALGHAGVVTRC